MRHTSIACSRRSRTSASSSSVRCAFSRSSVSVFSAADPLAAQPVEPARQLALGHRLPLPPLGEAGHPNVQVAQVAVHERAGGGRAPARRRRAPPGGPRPAAGPPPSRPAAPRPRRAGAAGRHCDRPPWVRRRSCSAVPWAATAPAWSSRRARASAWALPRPLQLVLLGLQAGQLGRQRRRPGLVAGQPVGALALLLGGRGQVGRGVVA